MAPMTHQLESEDIVQVFDDFLQDFSALAVLIALLLLVITYKWKQNEKKKSRKQDGDKCKTEDKEDKSDASEDQKSDVQQLHHENNRKTNGVQTKETHINKHEAKLAEVQQQLKDEQQRRQEAEENLQDLRLQLETKNHKAKDIIQGMQNSYPSMKHEIAMKIIEKHEAKLAEVQQQLKGEQQKRKKAEENLKLQLETKNQEAHFFSNCDDTPPETPTWTLKIPMSTMLENLSNDIDVISEEMERMKGKEHELKTKLETQNKQLQNNQQTDRSLNFEELKNTQILLESQMAENRNLQKQYEAKLAEVQQQLKDEQQKRKKAEENLQDQKLQLENKNQKNNQPTDKSLNFEELKKTQILLERRMAENRDLQKQKSAVQQQLKEEEQKREDAEKNVQTLKEALENKYKEIHEYTSQLESKERQLDELKDRYKEEFRQKIQDEQQLKRKVEGEVEILKEQLKNEQTEVKTIQRDDDDDDDFDDDDVDVHDDDDDDDDEQPEQESDVSGEKLLIQGLQNEE
ncbi:glutamic acid-rich protein-like isoform X7 [Melanotaenia boesemani]|uniref:glutamic acid-rich protein-like isoform X7 n=1 Tax=Melanotaenia boesemani TaxID=1250792 RepID=UPI001C042194|nr:glutamic acid-rich protein-like isoform X7 [Melanotaenia boesemani]